MLGVIAHGDKISPVFGLRASCLRDILRLFGGQRRSIPVISVSQCPIGIFGRTRTAGGGVGQILSPLPNPNSVRSEAGEAAIERLDEYILTFDLTFFSHVT